MAAQPQREWFEKDYYAALGVSSDADQKEITKAYRRIARDNHPDSHPGDTAAEERFKEASAAYGVVGDAEKRKAYDEARRLGPMGAGFGGGPGGGGPGGGTFTFDASDLGDLFGGLFGGGGSRGGARSRGTGPRRGADLEADLHLSFVDAVRGVTTSVHLTSDAACSTCHGSGAAPGTAPVVCSQCGGSGAVAENQGPFSFSQMCPRCGGRGRVVEQPCATCRGSGSERRARDVKVKIPTGVSEGQRIRLKGRGGPGHNGGPPGDLFVRVHVTAHPVFGRRGDDLTITVPISFAEASLGAKVPVPTLEGDEVTIRVPPGTSSGTTFRVKGRGVPRPGGAGHLLVTAEVAVPRRLTKEQKRAVEAYAAASEDDPRAELYQAATS